MEPESLQTERLSVSYDYDGIELLQYMQDTAV